MHASAKGKIPKRTDADRADGDQRAFKDLVRTCQSKFGFPQLILQNVLGALFEPRSSVVTLIKGVEEFSVWLYLTLAIGHLFTSIGRAQSARSQF